MHRSGDSIRTICEAVKRSDRSVRSIIKSLPELTVEYAYERTVSDLLAHIDTIRARLISARRESAAAIERGDAMAARNMTLTEAILLDKHSDILKEIERIRKLGGAKAKVRPSFKRNVVQLESVKPAEQKASHGAIELKAKSG